MKMNVLRKQIWIMLCLLLWKFKSIKFIVDHKSVSAQALEADYLYNIFF